MWKAIEQLLVIAGMLLFGAVNTVSKRWQNQSLSVGLDGNRKQFQKPWSQTFVMFCGEFLCLVVFALLQSRRKRLDAKEAAITGTVRESTGEGGGAGVPASNSWSEDTVNTGTGASPAPIASRASVFIFAAPTLCDLLGTTLSGIALLYTSASTWQMLRGSIIVFSSVFSVVMFRRSLPWYRWAGIAITTCGLVMVGAASLWSANDNKEDTTTSTTGEQLTGMVMILLGQVFSAAQMVVEEKLLKRKQLAPALVVGMEGLWGIMFMSLLILPIMYYIPGSDSGSYENVLDAARMVVNSNSLLVFVLAHFLSIPVYNFLGLYLTRELSAIHRTIIDGLRTLGVWTLDLFVFYVVDPQFGERLGDHSALQLTGFGIYLIGTLVYNRVLRIPFLDYARNELKEPDADWSGEEEYDEYDSDVEYGEGSDYSTAYSELQNS